MELVYQTVPEHPLLTPIRRIKENGPLDLDSGGWVAGGAAMRLLGGLPWDGSSDLDLFCRDREQAEALEAAVRTTFACPEGRAYAKMTNPRILMPESRLLDGGSPSRQRVVQIIGSSFYASVRHLLADIDFTVCRVATDGRTLVCDARALDDLRARVLRPVVDKRTRASAERVVKYLSYGFMPAPGLLEWVLALDRAQTTVAPDTLKVNGNWDVY